MAGEGCFEDRHQKVPFCANVKDDGITIRMPSCTCGTYPDDTEPTTCAAYLVCQSRPGRRSRLRCPSRGTC